MVAKLTVLVAFSCVITLPFASANRACLSSYEGDSCTSQTKLGIKVFNKVGECQPLLDTPPAIDLAMRTYFADFDGIFLKVDCSTKFTLAFYKDNICTQPLTHESVGNVYGYAYDLTCNPMVDPAVAGTDSYMKMELLLTSIGLPPAHAYQAQCSGCPAEDWKNPKVPTPSWPDFAMPSWGTKTNKDANTGKAPPQSNANDNTNGGHGHQKDRHRKGGGGVFLVVLIILVGISIACSCYWCACCPWYQHRTKSSHTSLHEVQIASVVATAEDHTPIVSGVPVESCPPELLDGQVPAAPYDPQPAK